MLKIVTAITGASGVIYGKRFVEEVNRLGHKQTLLITEAGEKVLSQELDLSIKKDNPLASIQAEWDLSRPDLISREKIDDITAKIASGSRAPDAVVVIPCTMGTLARVAHGFSSNLLERVCDVALKENKKLILVPRETPLNQIHLENMLALKKNGG